MGRQKCWQPSDGSDPIGHLVQIFKPCLLTLLGAIYESTDISGHPRVYSHMAHVCPFVFVFGLARNMKSGIDNSFLETHVEMLEQLFRLDPRGGFFKHDEIKRVLTHLCNEEAAAKKLAELSKKSKCSTLNTIERLAYSIRVMLAHVREKYNGQLQVAAGNKRPGPFDDIYAVLSAHEGSAPAATPAAQTRS